MSDYTLAHFNPKELAELDSWQGGRTNLHPHHPLRIMHGVEELLSHPDNERAIMQRYEHHAKGGRIGELLQTSDKMKSKGRNGDSEMAVIGPNTNRIFNRVMHGGQIKKNKHPSTGYPEYFNLGGFLGGIGKTLSGGINKIGSTLGAGVNNIMQGPGKQLMGYASRALPGMLQGGLEGGPEGALMGGAASLLGGGSGGGAPTSLSGLGQQFMQSPMGQSAMNSSYGRAAQGAYNAGQGMYNQAQNFMNSPGGQLAGHIGSAFMNSPYGQQNIQPYMQQGRDMYNQGQNMYNQANQTYGNMMNQGNQYAQRGQQYFE